MVLLLLWLVSVLCVIVSVEQNSRKQSATTVTPSECATIPKARAKGERQLPRTGRQCVCAVLFNRNNDTQNRNQPQQQQKHRTLYPYYLYLCICIKAQNINQHVLPCCFARQGSCVLQWQQHSQARVGITVSASVIKARKQSPG